MTVISLDAIWLNVADNPSDYLAMPKVALLVRTQAQPGRTSTQAGGRIRVISRAGQPRGWSLPVVLDDDASVAWLEAHVGVTLCARDPFGHKFFCVYLSVSMDDHGYYPGADTSLDLTEITVSESV